MSQIIGHQRHGTVGNTLLDLCKVYLVYGLALLQRLHHWSNVERLVACLDMCGNH